MIHFIGSILLYIRSHPFPDKVQHTLCAGCIRLRQTASASVNLYYPEASILHQAVQQLMT